MGWVRRCWGGAHCRGAKTWGRRVGALAILIRGGVRIQGPGLHELSSLGPATGCRTARNSRAWGCVCALWWQGGLSSPWSLPPGPQAAHPAAVGTMVNGNNPFPNKDSLLEPALCACWGVGVSPDGLDLRGLWHCPEWLCQACPPSGPDQLHPGVAYWEEGHGRRRLARPLRG